MENSRFTNSNDDDDNGTLRYGITVYDSLEYIDAGTTAPAFLPRAGTTLTLDSLDFFFVHTNVSNTNDTIHVIVFDRDSLKTTGTGSAIVMKTGTPRWDTLIITNQTIPTNIGDDGSGGFLFTDLTFYPNITFATGKTFGVRFEFSGDTTDHFYPVANLGT